MKKFMPVVMSSVLALPFAAAQAEGPIDGKVYGKINLAIVNTDKAGVKDTALESNASRLGFKGKSKLESGLSMVYQLEYEVNPTENNAVNTSKATGGTITGATGGTATGGKDTDTNIFKQRNAFVGIAGDFGTVLAGIHDTPLKLSQGNIDLFNDLPVGDLKSIMRGEVRATDVVAYASPTFSGVSLMAAATQYEDADEGKNNANSISVNYKNDNLYVALAMDSEVAGYDVTRVAAEYKMDAFTVGAIHNSSEVVNSGTSKSSDLISASYKIGDYKLKAQVGSGDEYAAGDSLSAFGVDYKLGKNSMLFAYTAKYSNDTANSTSKATAVGIEHKF
jgi:predicted porin